MEDDRSVPIHPFVRSGFFSPQDDRTTVEDDGSDEGRRRECWAYGWSYTALSNSPPGLGSKVRNCYPIRSRIDGEYKLACHTWTRTHDFQLLRMSCESAELFERLLGVNC